MSIPATIFMVTAVLLSAQGNWFCVTFVVLSILAELDEQRKGG